MVQYYWLAAFQRPIKTILKIEQMMAKFLWKRGMHSISWVRICRQTKNKKKKGQGLRKLSNRTQA